MTAAIHRLHPGYSDAQVTVGESLVDRALDSHIRGGLALQIASPPIGVQILGQGPLDVARPGDMPLDQVANLNQRIADGVIVANVTSPPSDYQTRISTLEPQLSSTCR
jgi:hypothetical protein